MDALNLGVKKTAAPKSLFAPILLNKIRDYFLPLTDVTPPIEFHGRRFAAGMRSPGRTGRYSTRQFHSTSIFPTGRRI